MKKTFIAMFAVVVLGGAGYLFVSRDAGGTVINVEGIDEPVNDIPTSADNAPPGSIHNLPVPQAVTSVKKYVAEKEGVSEGLVIVMTAFEKEWSDSCLGLGGPAESCLAAMTPGYEIAVQVNGAEQKFRTNADGSEIRME